MLVYVLKRNIKFIWMSLWIVNMGLELLQTWTQSQIWKSRFVLLSNWITFGTLYHKNEIIPFIIQIEAARVQIQNFSVIVSKFVQVSGQAVDRMKKANQGSPFSTLAEWVIFKIDHLESNGVQIWAEDPGIPRQDPVTIW